MREAVIRLWTIIGDQLYGVFYDAKTQELQKAQSYEEEHQLCAKR